MKQFFFAVPVLFSLVAGSAFAQTSVPPQAAAPAGQSLAASAQTPEIHELQLVEDKWSTALNQRDQYALELVLSPLFVDVSATGDVTSRNQQVVAVINQEDKTAVTDLHVVTVRVLGDVAVANGTYSYKHKGTNGTVEDRGVFTHVFERQHGNWVCLNAQRTLIREEVPGAKGKATKAKSKAEEPFHIPFFSKSDKSPQTD
jgi:ketosteroid isomerase-like protein